MPRNVEIKARIATVEELAARVARIATDGPTQLSQDDTFFRCERGRLKVRETSATEGELIYYRRSDDAGPKESFYLRSPTSAPSALRESLALACGLAGRVKKQRTVYLVGRTRVHLDVVEGLGEFLELEVVLEESETVERGVAEANELMAKLGVLPADLVNGAYVDLLHGTQTSRSTGSVPAAG